MELIEKKKKEFSAFEKKNKVVLPDEYKNYILARDDLHGMSDRPFEYVFCALKMRPQL